MPNYLVNPTVNPSYVPIPVGAGGSLQDAYDGGSVIDLSAIQGAVVIRDAAIPIGTLLTVQDSGGLTTYFSISPASIIAGNWTFSSNTLQHTGGVATAGTVKGRDDTTGRDLVLTGGDASVGDGGDVIVHGGANAGGVRGGIDIGFSDTSEVLFGGSPGGTGATVQFLGPVTTWVSLVEDTTAGFRAYQRTVVGGTGASVTYTAGQGAVASGATAGGQGGNGIFSGARGGDGTAGLAPGNGGTGTLMGGLPGVRNGFGSANGGGAVVDGAAGVGGGSNGQVLIGTTNALSVGIGRSGITTTVTGNFTTTGGVLSIYGTGGTCQIGATGGSAFLINSTGVVGISTIGGNVQIAGWSGGNYAQLESYGGVIGMRVEGSSGNVEFGPGNNVTVTFSSPIVGDLDFVKETTHVIRVRTSTTAATAGGALQIQSGNGNGAAGGAMSVDVGTGTSAATLSLGNSNAGEILIGRASASSKIGFFGAAAVIQQTVGAVTNSVTAGGVDGTIADFTDLAVYANDSATIRNDIYQLARSVAQLATAVRNLGLGV